MSRKRTLWDHYLDAVDLLARADVHLEFLLELNDSAATAELTNALRDKIAAYLDKTPPSEGINL